MHPDYTDEEWALAVEGLAGLDDMPAEEVLLLHRQWLWANQQRERLYELLPGRDPADAGDVASVTWGHMLAWYGFLWSVIEAFEHRRIRFGGPFGADIAAISDDLRRLRNAVFHVPDASKYHDQRLVAFVSRADSVALVRRVHRGFGRLFLTHLTEARATNAASD